MSEPKPPSAGDASEWFTAKEVADRWRVHTSTVYRMHKDDPEKFGACSGEAFGFTFRKSKNASIWTRDGRSPNPR